MASRNSTLSIDDALVEQARTIKAERERLWKIENAEAIEAENAYIDKHGLPLAKYRQF